MKSVPSRHSMFEKKCHQVLEIFGGHRPSRHAFSQASAIWFDALCDCASQSFSLIAFMAVVALRVFADKLFGCYRRRNLPKVRPKPTSITVCAMTIHTATTTHHLHMMITAIRLNHGARCATPREVELFSIAGEGAGPVFLVFIWRSCSCDEYCESNQDDRRCNHGNKSGIPIQHSESLPIRWDRNRLFRRLTIKRP